MQLSIATNFKDQCLKSDAQLRETVQTVIVSAPENIVVQQKPVRAELFLKRRLFMRCFVCIKGCFSRNRFGGEF